MTFVDETRTTPAFGGAPARSSRELVTQLWYPATGRPSGGAEPDAHAARGPFPLVVFNHGQLGEPQQYALTFRTWAEGGYVVAAPRHPLTVGGGPGAQLVDDMEGVLGDTSFVITRMEEELPDLVDERSVAVAGHSSGAIAAYAAGFHLLPRRPRRRRARRGAPPHPLDGEYAGDLRGTPVLFVNGGKDAGTLDRAREEFGKAEAPKFFLTVKGGDRSAMFHSGERAQLVADASLAFLDRSLQGRGARRLRTLGSQSPRAELEAVPG